MAGNMPFDSTYWINLVPNVWKILIFDQIRGACSYILYTYIGILFWPYLTEPFFGSIPMKICMEHRDTIISRFFSERFKVIFFNFETDSLRNDVTPSMYKRQLEVS